MRRERSKGQALVETALILLAFLTLLLGIGAVGEKLFVQQTLAERAHDAARWGALNHYDAAAIRNLVLYGTTEPDSHPDGFDGLAPADIVVANPGCPGLDCRITVAIPARGIRSVEPSPTPQLTDDAVSTP